MNKNLVRAALAVCLLGSAAAISPAFSMGGTPTSSPPPAKAAPGAKVSAPVGKLLQPAQAAMQANDFAGALVLIKQAQALPDQTPFDTYTINNFLANASIGLKDYDTADTAYEAMADSPALPDADKQTTLHNATLLAAQAKHYDKTIKFGTAYIALGGPPDATIISTLAQAYYFTNDFANAEAMAQKGIDATPAGEAPNRGALEILMGAQIKAKHQDQAAETLEKIVTYYDDADEWSQVIDFSLGVHGIKDVDAVHIYRLRMASKASGSPDDYTVAAALALSVGYPVEADAILQAGLASGKISNSGKAGQQIAEARNRAAADRKTIAGFDAVARKAATGELDLKLAETYIGYARYADAAEAARRSLQKGGPKTDANEANMVLGEALLMQGMTADAVTAFNNVKNASPGMTKAQHIWLLYANRKTAAAAPAAAH
jgi:hypothetical protein